VQLFDAAHDMIVFAIPAAYEMFVNRLLTVAGVVVSVPSCSCIRQVPFGRPAVLQLEPTAVPQ
jgi:hypothetical protein